MKKHLTAALLATTAVLGVTQVASAGPPAKDKTSVPGHSTDRYDQDGNGYSDAGVYVNGQYTALYAEDGNGDWYWDLGDGRILGSVASPDDLDPATAVTCDYVNIYRADFGNDPFMNTGWIHNHINCDDGTAYNYLIVHEDDPRYSGNGIAVWGTWEYIVLTQTGEGNIVPKAAVG